MSSDASSGHCGCDPDGFFDLDVPADVCDLFTHPRRATIWSVLYERDDSLSTARLVTHLVDRDTTATAVEAADHRREHVDLHHNHLPKLAAAGFVDWDRETQCVTLAAKPPVAHDRIETLLEEDAPHRSAHFEAALAHDRRRAILSVLAADELTGADDVDELTVSIGRLTSKVVAAEYEIDPDAVNSTVTDRVRLSLHHVHLPAMAEHGLLEYDPIDGTVTITRDVLESLP